MPTFADVMIAAVCTSYVIIVQPPTAKLPIVPQVTIFACFVTISIVRLTQTKVLPQALQRRSLP